MKPKTKKTLIIVAAVIAVAAILYFMLRGGKNSTSGIIKKLGLSEADRKKLAEAVASVEAYAAAHPTGDSSDGWAANQIEVAAKQANCTVAQMVVIHAAYAAFDEATAATIRAKILTM